MVDTADSKSAVARHGGSSPPAGTSPYYKDLKAFLSNLRKLQKLLRVQFRVQFCLCYKIKFRCYIKKNKLILVSYTLFSRSIIDPVLK